MGKRVVVAVRVNTGGGGRFESVDGNCLCVRPIREIKGDPLSNGDNHGVLKVRHSLRPLALASGAADGLSTNLGHGAFATRKRAFFLIKFSHN